MRIVTKKDEIYKLLILFHSIISPSLFDESIDISEYTEKIFNNALTYVIDDGNNIAGFISFYASDFSDSSYITLFAVTPTHQGTHVAYSLLNKCIEISISLNKNSIKLKVNKNNTKAIKFYRKNGFNTTEDSSKDSYFMEKSL